MEVMKGNVGMPRGLVDGSEVELRRIVVRDGFMSARKT
jgi:hypothetical protein